MTDKTNTITRRQFCTQIAAGTAGIALSAYLDKSCCAAALIRKPNILFIFSDQQRWDTVDCYGTPIFEGLTPNLDRLAADGVRFHNAFTCQPVCGPARASLQTGKYATEVGCFKNGIELPGSERTLAHRLSDQGYEVGYLGKWHLASTSGRPETNFREKAVPPRLRGGYKDFWLASDILEFTSHGYGGHMFDIDGNERRFDETRYRVDAQTDWAIEYLRDRKSKKPFFLFLSFIEPHHQNDHRHFEGPKGSKERFKDYRVPGELAGTKGDWTEEMPDYLGCCNSLDYNVGRMRKELERLGVADNTLIVYTTDHGCHFRTRNSEYKRSCHDNSIRIPLIIRGPGFRGGKVVNELVNLLDVNATVLKTGRAKLPEPSRGRPLQTLAQGNSADWPQDVFVQISESQTGRTLRTKRWKYSVRAPGSTRKPGSDIYIEDCLYDLENDPHERTNLAGEPKWENVRAKLAKRLVEYMTTIGEKKPVIKKKA